MTDLQKQFEATGYASWINSELYPDGQIYTKEYTEWLENKVKNQLNTPSFLESIKLEPITMQNQEKIIQAIAAYLERETSHCDGFGRGEWIEFGGSLNPAGVNHAGFCQEIASEIMAAIVPHLEAGLKK